MSLTRNVRIALDALLANKLRSILTMLGIIIGVGSVVALLSVGNGAQASITEQINGIGTNLVTVVPGQVRIGPPTGGNLRANAGGTAQQPLTKRDADALAERVPNVIGVAPEFASGTIVSYQKNNISVQTRGVTPIYAEVRNISMDVGRWIEPADDAAAARVAVLGPDAADALFGGLDPIGQRIRINNVAFTVIGVTVRAGSSFAGNNDTSVFVPLQTAYRSLFGGRSAIRGDRRVSVIYISAATNEAIPQVEADVRRVMREQHNVRDGQDEDFTVLTQAQFLSIAGNITGILTLFLAAIAGISLLVGGIGIMNIMLVSVTERTKEIGLRKAVGAKRRVILMQFLVETVTLSLLGGFIGIALGIGVAMLVSATGVLTAVITPESIVLAVSFSLAVGLFFGIYPANRAAGLQPIEALRYE